MGEGRGGTLPWGPFVVVRIAKITWVTYLYLFHIIFCIYLCKYKAPEVLLTQEKGTSGCFLCVLERLPLQVYRLWEGGPCIGGTRGPSGREEPKTSTLSL